MRTIVKKLIVRGLSSLRADALARMRHRRQTVVLAYHNIVPVSERAAGDESLHLPQEEFSRQLDILAETHEVVPLSSLLAEPDCEQTHTARMRAAITFDDAYRGALTVGLEELRRRELPATVFVTPTLLDEQAFWWDLLSSEDAGTVKKSLRESCLSSLVGDQNKILSWARTEGLLKRKSVPENARPGTVDLIREAAGQPEITLGVHGWLHLSLPSCSPSELQQELERPLQWFSERSIPFRRWFAFPYGRYSNGIARRVRNRYSLAFTTAGKVVSDDSATFAVPRVNIPAGISLHSFRLRASGLIDLIRR